MSGPSAFSSFPSFSTFPDLDSGPSVPRTKLPTADKGKERKHRKRDKKEDGHDYDGEYRKVKRKDGKRRGGEDQKQRRRRSRSQSPSRHVPGEYGGLEDERKKEKEDLRLKNEIADGLGTREGLVYFTDRKGDPLNVQYGGLQKGDVPKYRLVGGGKKVLGLSPELSVVYRGRGGVEVAPFGRRKMPSLADPSTRHKLAAGPTRRLLPGSEDTYKYREIDGFLRIHSNKPPKDLQPYRGVELSKRELDSDESEVSEDGTDLDSDSDSTPTTSLQSTLKELETKLIDDPQHIPTWLSLLSHTLTTVPSTTRNAAKARGEVSISVLSRALSAHPANKRSKTLRLKLLRAGEELWSSEQLRNEWEDALNVNDVEIWMAWLDWRLRRTSSLTESIVADVQRAYQALARYGDDNGQVRVFWRAAVALREAGYVERANALFQAQAEWLFAIPPPLLNKPTEEQLDGLEEFWDSEVPRLGEPNAKGWAVWHALRHEDASPSGRANPPPLPTSQTADPYTRWAVSEAQADRVHTMPLRSADDDDTSDPHAIVLLSDVRPLLIPLGSNYVKNVFRRAWLAFTGLHVPGFLEWLSDHPEDSTDDRWAYEHFATPAYLDAIFSSDGAAKRIAADSHAGVLVGREREYGSGFGPVKSWGYETIAPLDVIGSNKWMMWTSEDVRGVDVGLVGEIFRRCKLAGDESSWDVLHLAFESAVNIKSALKVSKSLLASARDSLPHWTAHARLECLRGRLDDARKVYHTILLANASPNRPGEGTMWWDWTQMEWLARNDDAAIQVILKSSKVSGSGGIAILRARRHFETFLDEQAQSGASWKERAAWVKIAALLELLTSSPQAALAAFDSALDVLEPGTPAHESLTVASLSMLYNHAVVLKSPTPPALLRDRVERAVEEYPNNTAVMGIFLEAEKGQGIWGRVRATLGETAADGTGKTKGVARRVAEVWTAGWEKGRWAAEMERTRSGLAAAVESDRTRGSAVLWKVFITFEIRAGELTRAKKLLFRAVGECPLVKDLYLLAFGALRAVFSAGELNQWADTMAERGLRMRVGLDEAVVDWTDAGAGRVGSDSDSDGGSETEDEIESSARERRRLMPY